MHNQIKSVAIAMVSSVLLLAPSRAQACTDPPPFTTLTFITITLGPPVQITLVFDPWTSFAATQTQFCACAFRFPTNLIDSIDDVRIVQTGTNTPIAGFFTWNQNATTSAEVESLIGSGAGDDWFGFLNDLSGAIPAGNLADFRVDVTLQPGVTLQDLQNEFAADGSNRVFTDEADANGHLLGTHGGFTDVSGIIPTVSEWGLIVMGLLLLTAGTVVIRRLQVRRPALRGA